MSLCLLCFAHTCFTHQPHSPRDFELSLSHGLLRFCPASVMLLTRLRSPVASPAGLTRLLRPSNRGYFLRRLATGKQTGATTRAGLTSSLSCLPTEACHRRELPLHKVERCLVQLPAIHPGVCRMTGAVLRLLESPSSSSSLSSLSLPVTRAVAGSPRTPGLPEAYICLFV